MGITGDEEGSTGKAMSPQDNLCSFRHILGWTPGYIKTSLGIPHMTKEH